jgi:HemK-related putative methylase
MIDFVKEGKVWHFNNRIIVTDLPSSIKKEAVFPLCYENTYFVKNLAVKEGDDVLDICTGSGILGIFSAQKASKVYVVDINQRALQFARLNAKFNDINNIEFLSGDLFKPVQGMKFDLITANPPFEPVSYKIEYPLHSVAGKRGTDVLKKILSEIDNYVKTNGSFQIISWIPEGGLDTLDNFNKNKYNSFKITKLQTYSPQQVQEYLKKRINQEIMINESYSLCFVQALEKK